MNNNQNNIGKIFMENIISRIKIKHTVGNFKDLAYQYYGKTLSNLFLINYTEKLWGDYSYNLDPTISGNRLNMILLVWYFFQWKTFIDPRNLK